MRGVVHDHRVRRTDLDRQRATEEPVVLTVGGAEVLLEAAVAATRSLFEHMLVFENYPLRADGATAQPGAQMQLTPLAAAVTLALASSPIP